MASLNAGLFSVLLILVKKKMMEILQQKLCVWAGVLFMALFAIGWWLLAGFMPPISPGVSGAEVANFYQANTTAIRLGLVITALSCAFYYPWIAALSIQINRIPGMKIHAWLQLISGATGAFIIYLPMMLWLVASFRLDRDPELILVINDLGWLIFTTTVAPFLVQMLAIAFAILSDRGSPPVFPRWLGFFNLAVPTLFFLATLIVFFKTGPLAWNGVLAFWVPIIDFFIWMIVMTINLFVSINKNDSKS